MTDLFDPFDLAGLNLTNRMIMALMTCTRADDAGVPTDPMREYYMQRASAGLIVTECTDVRPDSAGIMHAPGAYNAAQEAGWRKITDAVHAAGGRIYLQVWHGGQFASEPAAGRRAAHRALRDRRRRHRVRKHRRHERMAI